MIGVEDSLIDNMYHICEHTPQQNDEGEAANIVKKLILEFCVLQNVQPLVSHGSVVKLVVVGDHQEHTVGFVKTVGFVQNIFREHINRHMILNGIKNSGIFKSCYGINYH